MVAERSSRLILLLLLGYAILTMWVREPWALSLFQSAVFLLAAFWMAASLFSPRRIRGSVPMAPLAGILVWGAMQIIGRRTIYAAASWNSMLAWGTNCALFFLVLQMFGNEDLRRRFLRAAVWFGFVLSVVSTVQMFTSAGKVFWLFPSGYTDNVLGPFVSRNQYAAFMELLLPAALCEAWTRRSAGGAAMAAVMFASVIASASRAGSILVCGEVLAVMAFAAAREPLRVRSIAAAAGLFILLAAACTAVAGGGALLDRFRLADPYAGRREMFYSSLDMFRDRPWTGFGLGTWSIAYPRYARYDDGTIANQAHNDWAQWAVEGGAPLLLLMLSVAILSLRPALRSLWGIGIVAVWLHCLVDSPLQKPALAAWMFALLGLVAQSGGPWPAGGGRESAPRT
jgi:O-antigen ligase